MTTTTTAKVPFPKSLLALAVSLECLSKKTQTVPSMWVLNASNLYQNPTNLVVIYPVTTWSPSRSLTFPWLRLHNGSKGMNHLRKVKAVIKLQTCRRGKSWLWCPQGRSCPTAQARWVLSNAKTTCSKRMAARETLPQKWAFCSRVEWAVWGEQAWCRARLGVPSLKSLMKRWNRYLKRKCKKKRQTSRCKSGTWSQLWCRWPSIFSNERAAVSQPYWLDNTTSSSKTS